MAHPLLEPLRALDPATWATGLSQAGARAAWDAALSCVDPAAMDREIPGVAPRAVLVIASRNVFTAPLEWLLHLRARGVRVLLKPASGQEATCRAMAEAIGGVEIRTWRGGDTVTEAAALAEVDGVIAFGGATTIAAIRARVPATVRFLGFGPRFGVAIVDEVDEGTILDHVLYDGHGCMSPAAVFARKVDLDAVSAALAVAEARWPRGRVEPAEAASIRARVILARAVGEARVGPAWAALRIPRAHFTPEALARVVAIHPFDTLEEVRATLAPWAPLLGTIASREPFHLGTARGCAPGRMQLPEMTRDHDGVDVLAALWG